MTANGPNSQSVRIGGQVYQVNVTQAQVDARNIDRERARQLSRETARRRRALEDRRQQIELREEKKRQAELTKRREKQREATERYQRAHIPQRRRFSSPVLDKAYSAPALTTDVNLHSLSDTRFQSIRARRPVVKRDELEQHTARTLQSRVAFKDQFQRQQFEAKPQIQPQPPNYPRPSSVKTAWSNDPRAQFQIPLEAPVPKAVEIEEVLSEDEGDEDAEDNEENSTFIVETVEKHIEVKRCSTPELDELQHIPQPPPDPRPVVVDPRNIKLLTKVNSVPKERITIVDDGKSEQVSKKAVNSETPLIHESSEKSVKGILKRRVTRRIVSATGNRGIIAASIRDSLELAGGKTGDGQRSKTVRWDKLYYDDGSLAEFANDGTPKPIAPDKTKKGKNNRRVPLKKAQMKPPTPPEKTTKTKKGKKSKKTTEKTHETIMDAPMQYRHTSYTVAPTPSAAAVFKTEAPQFKPETNQISSRIPMPPTVARPLTSRTQILRSKRLIQTTNPIRVPPKNSMRMAEPNYVVNSNNQVNIHIGSVELSPELNRTPTENDITWLWERVRTVLETQQTHKRNRPSSTTIPKASAQPTFTKTRPHSAQVQSSSAAFALAEHLAGRGVTDDRIMNVINQPQTALSLEEQQIEQSLQRLDDRLLHIQETVGYNGIAFHNRH